MKTLLSFVFLGAGLLMAGWAGQTSKQTVAGRWDLTVHAADKNYPSWIEVTEAANQPTVRVVGRTGSVRTATNAKLLTVAEVMSTASHISSRLTFNSTESFEKPMPVVWDLGLTADGKLVGTQERSDGVALGVTGERAPALSHPAPAAWSEPEPLFDGADLQGWIPDQPYKNHWTADDGELVNQSAGANLQTIRKFNDFKLHIEYNCPAGGNSGVYLRGRYEVQVEYEPAGTVDKFHMMGSIYGFIAPAAEVPERDGRWESYDIMLIGRTVTVVRDDVKIIDEQEIPGITGGALDSAEADPGPINIQGDHTGGMKYRNIRISVPR